MTRKKNGSKSKMSRQPPLPAGLPPRPSAPTYPYNGNEHSTASRKSNGASYRPSNGDSRPNENYRPQRSDNYRAGNAPPMYEFRGSYDARPAYDSRSYDHGPPPRYDYAPGTGPPRGPASDSYRPRDDSFNFRYDAPPSISSREPDTYRPRSPPRQRDYAQPSRNFTSVNQANRAPYQRGGRGGYRGRGPRLASEREFLKGNREPTPELMPGMDEDETHGIRYKPVDDLSDSDEAEMDLSDEDGGGQPTKKQKTTTDGESVPRWSNPDPYTALPPPDESQRKKKDMVKLIRKARVTNGIEGSSKTEAANDDFISFDFEDEVGTSDDDLASQNANQVGNGVAGAPTGPRSSQPDNSRKQEPHELAKTDIYRPGMQMQAPPKKDNIIDLTADSPGDRKRARDQLKNAPLIYSSGKGKKAASGSILPEWKVVRDSPATPWVDVDHSGTASMGLWLHKEIMDFYHYVKPREFERVIRANLVEDLNSRVRERYGNSSSVHTFGSFPAGLFLPTADMDLVLVSDRYMSGGRPVHGQNHTQIKDFHSFLKSQGLPMKGTTEMIFSAKVPLVKYVDRATGLKVDISFENDTGLIANKTFQDWKADFPCMPILVTLIKHLLAMRGLNEPFNGGIGGFSVTCLVVSLLQHMPQIQSRSMIGEHNLGELLMEFLDLYGNQFNTTTTAIVLNPPEYSPKVRLNVSKMNPPEKFCIIDPNNSRNDISGGSTNSRTIIKCFSESFQNLQKRMGSLRFSENRRDQSLLDCIIGGNYESFKIQRKHLLNVHEKLYGPVHEL